MDTVFAKVAGLDVHQKFITVGVQSAHRRRAIQTQRGRKTRIRRHLPVPTHSVAVPTGSRLRNCGHRKKVVEYSFPKAGEQPRWHDWPDHQRADFDFRETAAY